MISKKGYLQITYLMMIVIMLLVIFAFSAFFYKYKNKFEEKAYSDACNQYLQLHLFSKKGMFDVDLDNFPCKTEDVIISIDETKSDGLQKYDVMQGVSEKMVACSNTYYRGEQELFTSDEERFCAACHKIKFTDNDLKISGLEWLSFQSTIKDDNGEKFLEILGGKDYSQGYIKNQDIFESSFSSSIDSTMIDTSKEYLSVFIYDKKDSPELWQKYAAGAGIGATVCAVGGVVLIATGVMAPAGLGLLAVAGGAAGGGISYAAFHESQDGDVWVSNFELVEFNEKNLEDLGCTYIVGMQEPGITSRADE